MEQRLIPIIVFCMTFIAAFTILLGAIPGQFNISTKDYIPRIEQVQDFFPNINLNEYAEFTVFQLNNSYDVIEWDIGGRNLRLEVFAPTSRRIFLMHRYGFNLKWDEALDWRNKINQLRSQWNIQGYAYLSESYLIEDYENNYLPYTATCAGLGWGSSTFSVKASFGFNLTAYDTISEAWDNSDLLLLIGIGQSDSNTALNVWDIVGKLLTFQILEIFGDTDPNALALNALIAFPIMIAMIVAAVVIVLEILPF